MRNWKTKFLDTHCKHLPLGLLREFCTKDNDEAALDQIESDRDKLYLAAHKLDELADLIKEQM